MPDLTEAEKQAWRDRIAGMGQAELAHMYRYSPAGHPVFDRRTGLYEYFQGRFQERGGMTPAISKAIG